MTGFTAASIRVVILEDRWQDAALMVAALEEAGFQVRSHVAGTEADFRAALGLQPDVILADYQLPAYDAMDALKLARQVLPDTPFIVVTGALGDEAAAACIREGATDYVLKDRLARLGSAVVAALEQRKLRHERQSMLDAVVESERRFRTVFHDSPVGIALIDPTGEVVEANQAFRRLLAIPGDDAQIGRLVSYVAPDEQQAFIKTVVAVRNGFADRDHLQVAMLARSGERVWAQITLSGLRSQTGTDGDLLAIIEDVTERVRAAEAARLREAILGAVGRSAELFLAQGDWASAVQGFLSLLGEAAGFAQAAVARWTATGHLEPLCTWAGRSAAETEGYMSAEWWRRICCSERDRTPRNAVTLIPASSEHEPHGPLALLPIVVRQAPWGCLVVEASEHSRVFSEAETEALQAAADLFGDAVQDREAAEELRASEARTRLLIETALDAVISTDESGRITDWNAQAAALFGWSPQEAEGRSLTDLIIPDVVAGEWGSHGIMPDGMRVTPGHPQRFETVALRKDGRIFPAEVAVAAAHLNASLMVGVFVRDLTQQMNAAFALNEVRRHDEAVAARIQEAMLEGDPPIDTRRIAIASRTLPGAVIAGDFVANLRHDEDTIDVVVGDVMGHGANAALLGAITKGSIFQVSRHLTLRLFEFQRLPEPHEVVAALHAQMTPELLKLESFVTLLYARIDLRRQVCTLVDCGHTRSVHYQRAYRRCAFIRGDNLPLGVLDREFFAPVRVPFEPGDLFVFYSDGVLEAEGPNEEAFGEERLRRAVEEASDRTPAELIGYITDLVREFRGDRAPDDDMTLLAVAIRDTTPEEAGFRETLEVSGSLDELEPVRDFIRDFCSKIPGRPLDPDRTESLILAVHEATCNVIKHAHHGRADIPVQLLAIAFHDRVEVRLFDSGTGFVPDDLTPPPMDGSQLAGYGWVLIRNNVDEYDYRRDDLGRNYLCLVKKR
ncbi:MAG: SpoIIE family protein phosphatase [Chthonomonadales bacterium]|nr:SpoIIE family protein phosphatase [Chthonomonadales bacterium]